MATRDLDAMLLSLPVDIQYLTDFCGEDAWAVVTHRAVTLLSDTRFAEELSVDHPYARAVIRTGSLADELLKVVDGAKIKRLGIQAEHISVLERQQIAKAITAKRIVHTDGWLVEQRAVKDEQEIATIQKAIAIQQKAFKQTLTEIKPGMTEMKVAARLEFNMRQLGAQEPSFQTIVGAGPNSSIPHYTPAQAKVRKNQPLLIDFGARYNGYCSDMTRVVCLGRFSPKINEIYNIVRDAMLAAIDAIAPGVPLKDVDAKARKLIAKTGYAKQFGHGLGHGIGLEIHESPRLSPKSDGLLQPGQIVTVEPGIYLPGIGGVRLEDDILVTQSGHKNLCSLPTATESAMI